MNIKKRKDHKKKFEEKNILLLGAAGTIGSEILKNLLNIIQKNFND